MIKDRTLDSIINDIDNVNNGKSYNIIIKNKNMLLSKDIIKENMRYNNCLSNRTYVIEYEEFKREIDEFFTPIYTPFLLIVKAKEILRFLPFAVFKEEEEYV